MTDHRIRQIMVSRIGDGDRVRAEAIVLLGGETKTLASEETPPPGETLAVTEDRALAGLRKTLYAAGVPKRAIATAVNAYRESKKREHK
jgi:hypothetical protein